MTFAIHGIDTALPKHTMSQAEATELAQQVICRDEQQRRLVAALYRKAGVENRFTALPHRTALRWLPEGVDDQQAAKHAATYGGMCSRSLHWPHNPCRVEALRWAMERQTTRRSRKGCAGWVMHYVHCPTRS